MRTSSAKAKGRRLQQKVRDDLRVWGKPYGIEDGDVESTSMGCSGVDVRLSPKAKAVFPFHIECKNCESLNVHKIFSEHYEKYKNAHGTKLLIHSKNRSEVLVTLRWEDFKNVFAIPKQ